MVTKTGNIGVLGIKTETKKRGIIAPPRFIETPLLTRILRFKDPKKRLSLILTVLLPERGKLIDDPRKIKKVAKIPTSGEKPRPVIPTVNRLKIRKRKSSGTIKIPKVSSNMK